MFLKPFRVKTQTTMKGSDRKKLRADIEQQYPGLSSGAVADLIPNKGDLTQVKLESHSEEHFLVYCFQKNPVFFESFKKLYPTVYTLWKFPDMLPVFTTYPPVFQKLLKGADLMLPGVEVKGEHHPKMFGNLQKGDLCIVRLKGNRAPVLLGEALLSGEDMYMSAMRGKGVRTIHIFQDHLWEMGDKSMPPLIPDDEPDEDDSDDSDEEDKTADDEEHQEEGVSRSLQQLSVGDGEEEGAAAVTNGADDRSGAGGGEAGQEEEVGEEEEEEEEEEDRGAAGGETAAGSSAGPADMDELLRRCFKWAIKGRVSKNDLPLLTSNLLKGFMQPFCAAGEHLDVKKSSYKKFSKFLQQMESEGFIRTKEISKGVDAITEIDKSHAELRGLEIPEIVAAEEPEEDSVEVKFEPPEIKEVLCVTAAVLPLLSPKGYSKGSTLTVQELRQLVTEYVKTENLQSADNRDQVLLDPILAGLLLTKNEGDKSHLTWNTLFNRLCDKLQPGCLIRMTGREPVLKKGKMPPITFKVVQRGSKKKVTMVHNLESYGVDTRQFAHMVQRKIACSASPVSSERQGGGMDVQVQGNQTEFIVQQLLETYQIPRKYIEGADSVKKSKRR
ncbi:eukaryotic translation initiation factor 2D-like [Babylonia areolata]|uniref:eukaryotic translation initiation factor 2D-like n=1 Tax=Babylonia areolata TaxID=304850 RepID=UPI003FD4F652